MFKRELSVKMSKPEKDHATTTPFNKAVFEKKIKLIGQTLETSIVKIGVFVCAYVVLDTARQVLVTKAAK